jgi:hypothetical protein
VITPECFQQGMTILADRYGRALKAPTQRVYYERLSRELTDAEFIAGVMLAIDASFMPAPGDIIAAAKPASDFKIEAEDAWTAILQTCRAMPWKMIPHERFSAVWWKAIAAAGGIKTIALAEPEAAPHVHRKFVEHYARVQADTVLHERAALTLDAIDPRARVLVERTTASIGGGNG